MSPIKKTILYCIFFFMDVDHAEASTAIPPQDRFDLHHHSHKAYEGDNLALAHSLPQSLLLHRPLLLRLPPILLG